MKRHFCIDLLTILVSHQAVPPTFYHKIAPMLQTTETMGVRRWENGHLTHLEIGNKNQKFVENLKSAA